MNKSVLFVQWSNKLLFTYTIVTFFFLVKKCTYLFQESTFSLWNKMKLAFMRCWRPTRCHPCVGTGNRGQVEAFLFYFFACDVTPLAWWHSGKGVWLHPWTPVELALCRAVWTLKCHQARYRDILSFYLFLTNTKPPPHHQPQPRTHKPQSHLACSGNLTEQRPCISGSEV